ncbi:outer membrane protein [Qipengyuania sediminis]|uniref:outer membrane protein n=1 Tax=Qipengyuania sediminis TaxID=1532023 RepID=UPI0010599CD0|nr:outer membrane beta-barrel protein [Qipengyuania sediminis]
MKNLFLTAASGAALFAVPATAQDESARSEFFNGFYVGGTVGIDTTANSDESFVFDTNRDGNFDNTVRTVAGANAFAPGFCGGNANANNAAGGCSSDEDDLSYAVRIGVDRRLGDNGLLVAGLLAEATKHESTDFTSAFSSTPASYTIARGLDHSFALRGRLGISPGEGRGLFYVTGGVAYGKLEHDFATSNTANSFTEFDDDDYQLGGQIGGGAEIHIARNLSIGLEYVYQTFEDEDYYVAVGQGTAPLTNPFLLNGGGTNLRLANTDYDLHSFKAGVNFRF